MREAVVADVTPPSPEGVRAPAETQVAVLSVSSGARSVDIALVLPGFTPSSAAGESVAADETKYRPTHLVAIEHAIDTGVATVATMRAVDEYEAFMVAAATAVVQYAWAWDESPFVRITVNGIAFAIEVTSGEGKTHVARQVESTLAPWGS